MFDPGGADIECFGSPRRSLLESTADRSWSDLAAGPRAAALSIAAGCWGPVLEAPRTARLRSAAGIQSAVLQPSLPASGERCVQDRPGILETLHDASVLALAVQ
jgi:hypothetical protein